MQDFWRGIKQTYYDFSILKKLYVLIFISIIPIMIIAIFTNTISSEIVIDKTDSNALQNLTLVSKGLDNVMDSAENQAYYCVLTNNIQNYLNKQYTVNKIITEQSLQLNLDGLIGTQKLISSAAICGFNGDVVLSSTINASQYYASSDRNIDFDYIHSLHGSALWLPAHIINYEKNYNSINCITLIRPVLDLESANCLGYIELNINENIISSAYSQICLAATDNIYIMDKNGTIVSSKNKSEIHRNIKSMPYYSDISQKPTCKVNFFGVDSLVISKDFSRNNWRIVGSAPIRDLTAENRKLSYSIFGVGFVCILFSMLLLHFLSRSITRPILRLSKAISGVDKGNMGNKVEVMSNDEIGRLSNNYNIMLDRISNLMEQIYWEQKKKRQYELAALQSQINPHFLYNTLDSIRYLALVQRSEDIFNMITALAMFYRTVLSKGENIITVKEEIDNVSYYLTIQKIRYENKFTYSLDVDKEILDSHIVKLSLQPLVENSIYHGIRPSSAPGQINIRGYIEDKNIVIIVSDNGIGMKSELTKISPGSFPETTGRSFGLKSVDERIKIYFGNEYGIRSVTSKKNSGTTIEIVLPFRDDEPQLL